MYLQCIISYALLKILVATTNLLYIIYSKYKIDIALFPRYTSMQIYVYIHMYKLCIHVYIHPPIHPSHHITLPCVTVPYITLVFTHIYIYIYIAYTHKNKMFLLLNSLHQETPAYELHTRNTLPVSTFLGPTSLHEVWCAADWRHLWWGRCQGNVQLTIVGKWSSFQPGTWRC